MAIEIIEFFEAENQDHWINEIGKSDWDAAKYLSGLLRENKLKDLCGPTTKLFMLTEDNNLYSFCTLAEQDEINAPEMTPWIGFVYTFPDYRGHYFASTLLETACEAARENGAKVVYTSPSDDTKELYLKFGFTVMDYPMTSIYGYETLVYKKDLV